MGIGYIPPFPLRYGKAEYGEPGRRLNTRMIMRQRQKPRRKGGVRYPWYRWFRMDRFRLRYGREYFCRSDTMVVHIRRMARRYGIKVTTHIAAKMMSVTVIVLERDIKNAEYIAAQTKNQQSHTPPNPKTIK